MKVREYLLCAVYGGLAGLLVTLTWGAYIITRTVTQTVSTLPAVVERCLNRQGEETRKVALQAIADTRRETLAEVARMRRELLARADKLSTRSETLIVAAAKQADSRLGSIQEAAHSQLSRVNDSLAKTADTVAAARPVLDHAAGVVAQVDDALPLFLDCDHNADCIYNRWVGTARSTETAMRAVALSAPATTKSVENTARSVESIAHSWEKQTPLYMKATGWVVTLGLKLRGLLALL